MHVTVHSSRPWRALALLVPVALACGPGCSTVLSTASLRDLVWDAAEPHAAEAAVTADDPPASESTAVADDQAEAVVEESPAAEAIDEQRREAAIDEAVARLARLGTIDPAARATLVETLERTAPEDWPAVIDAFAESLPPETRLAAKADLDSVEASAAEAPPPAPEPAAAVATEPAPESPSPKAEEAPIVTVTTPSAEPPPAAREPATPTLAVENACFATRVQAWGVVDRFPADRFRPGQEVIVYFELAGLSASGSAAGHTTCIDSTLRLVGADGAVLHTWSFEPIAETCRARRQDYFARYVVRLPETTATGGCRIELSVTDTLSGQVASTTLPLELVEPLAAR